ncbi:methenyltetrahydrofolate synthetase [Brevipalpus obovatus]|uniref:methenyltetrahydrofolate synthetase n=1 Tax=Brevipalpus obovatus TaxID=246614 RepID=UPI003D9EF379
MASKSSISSKILKKAKKELRSEIEALMSAMSPEDRITQSSDVYNQLINHELFQKAKRVSIFLSMPEELNTIPIVKKIFEQEKKCFIPRIIFGSQRMDMVLMSTAEEIDALPVGKYGLRQPATVETEAIESGGLDLMIMPGVAFDKEGHRLGHGMGYYDVYLKRYKEHFGHYPNTIAVAFKQQIVQSVPVGPNDVTINQVLHQENQN